MIRPISYLQTDAKWKNYNYSAKGESKTIGNAGCGPTSAAMVIAALADKNVTPITTAEWSMAHGYKALNQGTYYTYFVPQLAAYGITCRKLNSSNLYGTCSSSAHTEALNALKNNDWVIACMGPGNWTSSGHFILLYGYENGYVYINDPASTAASRVKNTWTLFSKQVKYLWTVSVPSSFKNGRESSAASSSTSSSSTATPSSAKELIKTGQQHAINFTGVKIDVDGVVGAETKKMRARVVQRAMNLDYGNTISEDGVFGAKSKAKLGSHYIKYGEKQYMVTAAEILMYLSGIDPNGVELPGNYGDGLTMAVKSRFGGNGQKMNSSDFLTLIG